jgi:hypothetical protein
MGGWLRRRCWRSGCGPLRRRCGRSTNRTSRRSSRRTRSGNCRSSRRYGRSRWRRRPRSRWRRGRSSRGRSSRGRSSRGRRTQCRLFRSGLGRFRRGLLVGELVEMLAHQFGMLDVERTRVRLLFGDADFRQVLDQYLRLDLKLASEFVNSDLIGICHSFLTSSLKANRTLCLRDWRFGWRYCLAPSSAAACCFASSGDSDVTCSSAGASA